MSNLVSAPVVNETIVKLSNTAAQVNTVIKCTVQAGDWINI